MSEPLVTFTIHVDDTPTYSILRGHHLTETFNVAFVNEGWHGLPDWQDCDVTHEYWEEIAAGVWVCSNKNNPKAEPVTVGQWYSPDEKTTEKKVIH